jgi:hypothetical protein
MLKFSPFLVWASSLALMILKKIFSIIENIKFPSSNRSLSDMNLSDSFIKAECYSSRFQAAFLTSSDACLKLAPTAEI